MNKPMNPLHFFDERKNRNVPIHCDHLSFAVTNIIDKELSKQTNELNEHLVEVFKMDGLNTQLFTNLR